MSCDRRNGAESFDLDQGVCQPVSYNIFLNATEAFDQGSVRPRMTRMTPMTEWPLAAIDEYAPAEAGIKR